MQYIMSTSIHCVPGCFTCAAGIPHSPCGKHTTRNARNANFASRRSEAVRFGHVGEVIPTPIRITKKPHFLLEATKTRLETLTSQRTTLIQNIAPFDNLIAWCSEQLSLLRQGSSTGTKMLVVLTPDGEREEWDLWNLRILMLKMIDEREPFLTELRNLDQELVKWTKTIRDFIGSEAEKEEDDKKRKEKGFWRWW